jgi:hypothetical protein
VIRNGCYQLRVAIKYTVEEIRHKGKKAIEIGKLSHKA